MKRTIIIGDSSHNTLSVVRSLGKARLPFDLLLTGDDGHCNVAKSRYVCRNHLYHFDQVTELKALLDRFSDGVIICTFDAAAEWVDEHEEELSKRFVTPCRGKRIGRLFDKEEQCRLAESCGLTVPRSQIFHRTDDPSIISIPYPIVLKPLQSTQGEKTDIHIVRTIDQLQEALSAQSNCDKFILQEFVEKEYELDCIGVVTDSEMIVAGAVRKIRHYPHLIGAGAYGRFKPVSQLDIDIEGLRKFMTASNYHGPFSVEFLHTTDGKNYFMEVNFRNEGLAQVATDAGANLHALYVDSSRVYRPEKVQSLFMMNYSVDLLHIKEGRLTRREWLRDLFRTRSFINLSLTDPKPVLSYYASKMARKLRRV